MHDAFEHDKPLLVRQWGSGGVSVVWGYLIYGVYMRRAPVGWLPSAVLICMVWVWQSPPVGVGFVSSVMRRCATLPHPVGCSTIAVPGLSFRVRNGSGRLPWAMAAASLQLSTPLVWVGCVVVWGPVGGRDACVCS